MCGPLQRAETVIVLQWKVLIKRAVREDLQKLQRVLQLSVTSNIRLNNTVKATFMTAVSLLLQVDFLSNFWPSLIIVFHRLHTAGETRIARDKLS